MSNTETLREHIAQLREWADGNRLGGGMGSGLHAEKWPALTPGARRTLSEHVTWMEQALTELEAAQQWRPMSEAPKDGSDIVILYSFGTAVTASTGHWSHSFWAMDIRPSLAEYNALGWLPLPEPPKEGT